MEFKIDTKDSFTIIMPLNGAIDAKMADALQEKCEEMRQSGSKNFIIDMQKCGNMDENAVEGLIALHEECYGMEQSLVYTAFSKDAISVLKEDESDLLINIAPTMKEAVDIISMEILERDLFSEE